MGNGFWMAFVSSRKTDLGHGSQAPGHKSCTSSVYMTQTNFIENLT